MIKAKGTFRGRETFVIGLSYLNLERLRSALKDDTYIHIDGREHGIPIDIVVVAGPTEQDILDMMGGNTVSAKVIIENNKRH